jgi:Cytidylyltransferase family.
MNLNFSNRIFTSLILLSLLFVGLSFNKFLWLYLLIIASLISYYEFTNLIKKKFKKQNNKIYIYNIITFIYLCFLTYIGYDLYDSNQ